MKMTNRKMIDMLGALDSVAEKKLPQKISYAITRNLILLQKDYESYLKSLNKLFESYNDYIVKDENGDIIKNDIGFPIVNSEVEKEFNKEISDLLNIEIEIPLYHIPENTFDYEDNERYDALSAKDIMKLRFTLCKHKYENSKE